MSIIIQNASFIKVKDSLISCFLRHMFTTNKISKVMYTGKDTHTSLIVRPSKIWFTQCIYSHTIKINSHKRWRCVSYIPKCAGKKNVDCAYPMQLFTATRHNVLSTRTFLNSTASLREGGVPYTLHLHLTSSWWIFTTLGVTIPHCIGFNKLSTSILLNVSRSVELSLLISQFVIFVECIRKVKDRV